MIGTLRSVEAVARFPARSRWVQRYLGCRCRKGGGLEFGKPHFLSLSASPYRHSFIHSLTSDPSRINQTLPRSPRPSHKRTAVLVYQRLILAATTRALAPGAFRSSAVVIWHHPAPLPLMSSPLHNSQLSSRRFRLTRAKAEALHVLIIAPLSATNYGAETEIERQAHSGAVGLLEAETGQLASVFATVTSRPCRVPASL